MHHPQAADITTLSILKIEFLNYETIIHHANVMKLGVSYGSKSAQLFES